MPTIKPNCKMAKRILTTLILIFTLSIQSCSSDDETPALLAIGDFHQGGVIFYLDETGEHGLISSVTDQSFSAAWGCPPLIVDGADGIAIGTGAQNTLDILATCNTAGIAADICDKLDQNDFSDWFLPSKEELNVLYQNRDKVNETSLVNSGSVLEVTEYWSSSHENLNRVWIQSFNAGNQSGDSEDAMNNVRAIRAF